MNAREVFSRLARPRWLALALLAITSVCIWVPLEPVMPGRALDEAWAVALNEAVARDLVFGRDVIFTFGPYSFVSSWMYHPALDGLMLVSSLYLAVTYWVALVLLTQNARAHLGWALLLVLAGWMNARDTLLLSYPLVVGLVLVRRPDGAKTAAAQPREQIAMVILITSSLGLLPLIKGSMLALCALVVPIAFVGYAVERRWRLATSVALAPVLSLVVWWVAVGQPLTALPQHFHALMPLISGYAGAMAFPGDIKEVLLFLAAAAALAAALLASRSIPRRERVMLLGVYAAFYFVSLKAGFVRHDSHALICGLSALLAAVVFTGTMTTRLWPVVLLPALVCFGFINKRHYHLSPRVLAEHTLATYRSPVHGIEKRLREPGLAGDYQAIMQWIGSMAPLPRLDGTSDVYSFNQTELIASGNRWNPRPVLQSYSVYAEYLDARNRAHLAGAQAPDNLFFRVEPIDLRLPSLDDGGSWPLLLTRYLPVDFVRDILILRRRPEPAPLEMTTMSRVTGRIGKLVIVPSHDDELVFAEIDVEPSLVGRILGLAYKPTPLWIYVTPVGGLERMYRFSANMGRLGILISPLVESTRELASIYGGVEFLYSKRLASFRIVAEGSKLPWKRKFTVTFRSMRVAPTIDARTLYQLATEAAVSVDPEPASCEGVFDSIGELSPVPHELEARGILTVRGWLATSVSPAIIPAARYVVLTDAAGRHRAFGLEGEERADVAKYFKDPVLAGAGFRASVDISTLDGTFTLGLAVDIGGRIRRCSKWNHVLHTKPLAR